VASLTQTLENCKADLAVEALRAGGSIRLQVLGSSMLPSVWPGDIVNVDGGPIDEIVPGDIVLCERESRFFVHRLVGRYESQSGVFWITRGDSMPQNDPLFSDGQLLGRVSSIHRNGRATSPKGQRSEFSRLLGWMLCHSDSLRNLALRLHALRGREGLNWFCARSTQSQTPQVAHVHQKGG
jgi:signal peptidase